MKHVIVCIALVAIALASGAAVNAQPLGTFRWQLQPHCNVVTLNIVGQQGSVFTLDGFDDQCGAGQRASVVGTAFPNPDGTIGIGLNTVLAPGGAFVHVEARISLASLNGPWRDSAGNSGTFAFTPGAGAGGPVRPVPANGVAAASISAGQLAPGAGAAHINPAQVQARVTGACAAGQYLRGINENGSVLCEPLLLPISASASRASGGFFLSQDLTMIASLSADGSGSLNVPFRARLLADGSVTVRYSGMSTNQIACRLRLSSGDYVGNPAILALTTGAFDTIPIMDAIDVAPGVYDLQVWCSSFGNHWAWAQLNVIAVPR